MALFIGVHRGEAGLNRFFLFSSPRAPFRCSWFFILHGLLIAATSDLLSYFMLPHPVI
jgi:hypothetical protein